MALPLPQGKSVQVYKRVMSGEFKMDSLEAAADHYLLNFIVHGDRTVITPRVTYTIHSGEILALPPYLYHKTVPASSEYYESILIKFSKDFVKPFTDKLGGRILEEIYDMPYKKIESEEKRNIVFKIAWDMLKVAETPTDSTYDDFKLQIMLFQLLLFLYEYAKMDDGQAVMNPATLSPQIMDAVYFIESEYSHSINIADAAKRAGYSVSYFSRLFQNQLGVSYSEYCNNVRLRHVQHELLTTEKTITEIALDTGFSFPGNMSSCFKKKYGISPLQYKKQQKVVK